MKYKSKLRLFLLLSIVIFFLCCFFVFAGCSFAHKETYVVLLQDNENYEVLSEQMVTVKRGETVEFDLKMADNIILYDLNHGKFKNGKIIVENVMYDMVVNAKTGVVADVNFSVKDENGAIQVVNEQPIFIGDTIKFEYNSNKNYAFEYITIDGKAVNLSESGSFKKGSFEHKVTSSTVNIEYKTIGDRVNVYYDSINDGSISVGNLETHRFGENLDISVVAGSGKFVSYVVVNGENYVPSENMSKFNFTLKIETSINIRAYFCDVNSPRIVYNANGGEFINGGVINAVVQPGTNFYLDNCYKKIKREGYILTGLNTKADGTGKHHSLGAMIRGTSGNLTLYAEWEKVTELKYLDYKVYEKTEDEEGYAVIFGLSGAGKSANLKSIVLPETINGYDVGALRRNSFKDNATVERIVLPNTLEKVDDNVFVNTLKLREVVLFDNLKYIYSNTFVNCNSFDKIVMHSATARIYENLIESSYADKVMRLEELQKLNKKKIVIISGCAAARGLDLEKYKGNDSFADYELITMGVHAGVGVYFMYDTIKDYISPGDIVIYTPELRNDSFGNEPGWAVAEMWQYFESNYDMLKSIGVKSASRTMKLFNTISLYLLNKNVKYQTDSYYAVKTNRFNSVDEAGCFTYERKSSVELGISFSVSSTGLMAKADLLKGDGVVAANNFNELVKSRGATMYFSYAPVYRYTGYDNADKVSEREEFESVANQVLNFDILGRVSDFALSPEYINNHVNHCSTAGTVVYTELLLEKLKAQMIIDGLMGGAR